MYLRSLRGEKGDGGLGGGERQAPIIGPLLDPGGLASEGRCCISVVTGGDGVCEVICI